MPLPQPDPGDAPAPALSAAVGGRIRGMRAGRGITLTELAAATGLGKGTLSELERGQRNPTLDTLFAVATALSVPLSELLAEGRARTLPPSARGPHAHGQSLNAELIGRWDEPSEVVEVYRMTLRRGWRRSRPHLTGVIESITAVSGEIAVGHDDAPIRLIAGQSHTFAGDHDHIYEGRAAVSSAVLVMRYPLASETQGERREPTHPQG